MVIVVFGLPGSGKSTLAMTLAGRLQASYVSSDRIRKAMIRDVSYTPEEKAVVYDRMVDLAREAVVRLDDDVVVDATFHLAKERQLFREAIEPETSLYFIEVRAQEELIRERLAKPREDSDADFAVYVSIKTEWEPEDREHLELWSDRDNLEEMVRLALEYMNIVYDGADS
jgi:predicted kinase